MPECIRFAVMGDVHYVQPAVHRLALGGGPAGVTEVADLKRNLWMTRNVTPQVIAGIAGQKPDFVVQTGDFIQGHGDDLEGDRREMLEAMEMMESLGAPLFFALGTHDGPLSKGARTPVRELLLPAIGRNLGITLQDSYYSFSRGGSLFVILDYTTFRHGDAQAQFVRNALASSGEYEHVFLFAHPPLIPAGRPFFASHAFSATVVQAIASHRAGAYFCGHTHNQVATIHRVGGGWLPQLKSSILGYPGRDPVLLTDVRPLLPDPASYELGWALLEDSAPGWWLVTVEGDTVRASWYVLHQGLAGQLFWQRGQKPYFTKTPAFASMCRALPPPEQIRGARLRAAGSRCATEGGYSVTLNGTMIGHLPRLEYFDCRQFLELTAAQWALLRQHNTLQVTTADEEMCIGGFVLEIETDEGRVCSRPSPYYYTNTNRWDMWNALPIRHIGPGETVTIGLSFAPRVPDEERQSEVN